MSALSVFRRPVNDQVLLQLGLDDSSGIVAELEERFLVERDGAQIGLMPMVREVALEEWSLPTSTQRYHATAATYYRQALDDKYTLRRFEARTEAIYHLTSSGDFKAAQALGFDWTNEARIASLDLFKDHQFERCLEVCEELLRVKPTLEIQGRRVLCLGRLARWKDANAGLAKIREAGQVPSRVLTGLGESLIKQGILSEGIMLLEEARATEEKDAYICAVLAEALIENQQVDRAADLAAEALEADPNSRRALQIASRVARLKGNPESAYKFARKAMSLDPVRSEQTFSKAMSALNKKYDGKIPSSILEAGDDPSLA